MIGIDHIKELVDDSVSNVKKDDPSLIASGRVKLLGEEGAVSPPTGCKWQAFGTRTACCSSGTSLTAG